jgi:hypothetical protein
MIIKLSNIERVSVGGYWLKQGSSDPSAAKLTVSRVDRVSVEQYESPWAKEMMLKIKQVIRRRIHRNKVFKDFADSWANSIHYPYAALKKESSHAIEYLSCPYKIKIDIDNHWRDFRQGNNHD